MDTKGNLLVIDDEIEILNTLKLIFQIDYKLYTAQSPNEAFDIMKRYDIQVIICDQQMPEMKGIEFFKIAKDLYPNTIRILTTGYSELSDAIMSINDGHIFRYITKPWKLVELRGSVTEAFEKSALKKENLIMIETIKNSNILLKDKVRERTQDLEKNNKQLQKLLTSQEDFIVNISHELKTPLNVIFSTAQLFDTYCACGSLDEKRGKIIKYIGSIKQNSYRLSKLINNIVDISKISSGFFDLHLSNNNIVAVVEEIVMSVNNFVESKGLNITFDTDIEEKIIACDPEMIERILLNLISNAIKFSNVGNKIFVDIKDKNEFVEISVKDNGIGIEDKNLTIIFDRFKQADKSLSRNAEGTGIGLNLVKSIVELLGGSITVESKLKKGSKFTVSLPSRKVLKENIMCDSGIKGINQNIQVEFSDINS